VELLIGRSADLNLVNDLGVTPLTTASLSGYEGIARLLERNGAIAGPEVQLEQILASSEYISAGGLAALCSSTLNDSVAFCDGYMKTVLHFRKMMASCMSEDSADQTGSSSHALRGARFQAVRLKSGASIKQAGRWSATGWVVIRRCHFATA
jgi:hypothetical protein